MLLWVNVGIAGMRNDEVQAVRGKGATEQVVRSAPMLSPWNTVRIAQRTRHVFLKARGRTVRVDEVPGYCAPGGVYKLLRGR